QTLGTRQSLGGCGDALVGRCECHAHVLGPRRTVEGSRGDQDAALGQPRHGVQRGFAAGANTGIRHADADVVVLLNNDAEPAPLPAAAPDDLDQSEWDGRETSDTSAIKDLFGTEAV
ncbi:hypothetical protein IAE22_32755, partial [Bacillus sp. S34]|nr:hypothetical protein [Bacillus sp. S34]